MKTNWFSRLIEKRLLSPYNGLYHRESDNYNDMYLKPDESDSEREEGFFQEMQKIQ
jgi:hypothetical protein|eukprot:evm.model.NODE_5768_length_38717_cov_23.994007.16